MYQKDFIQKIKEVLKDYDGIIMYINYKPDNLLSLIQLFFCTEKKIYLIFPITKIEQYKLFDYIIKNLKQKINSQIKFEVIDETNIPNIMNKYKSILLCIFKRVSPIFSNQLMNFKVKQYACTLLFHKERYLYEHIELFSYFKQIYIFDKRYAYCSSNILTYNFNTVFLNFLEDYLKENKIFDKWLELVEERNKRALEKVLIKRNKCFSLFKQNYYDRIIRGIIHDKYQFVIGSYGALVCFLLKNSLLICNCIKGKSAVNIIWDNLQNYKIKNNDIIKILEDKINIYDNQKRFIFKEIITDLLFDLFYCLCT